MQETDDLNATIAAFYSKTAAIVEGIRKGRGDADLLRAVSSNISGTGGKLLDYAKRQSNEKNWEKRTEGRGSLRHLTDNIGDLFCHMSILCHILGLTTEDIINVNAQKLLKRHPQQYPEFTAERWHSTATTENSAKLVENYISFVASGSEGFKNIAPEQLPSYAVSALTSEMGELPEIINGYIQAESQAKKVEMLGHIVEELGDCWWYVIAIFIYIITKNGAAGVFDLYSCDVAKLYSDQLQGINVSFLDTGAAYAARNELEYKLLCKVLSRDVLRVFALRSLYIEQTYLDLAGTKYDDLRIRKIKDASGQVSFIKTGKCGNGAERPEDEWPISEQEYLLALQNNRLLNAATIKKTRYRLKYLGYILEFDFYHEPVCADGCVICEIEVNNWEEKPSLPDFVQLIADVTHDPNYKNRQIAVSGFPKIR